MHRTKGFSLIELMIAVAIVAILASIAYPSYQNYVIRSNRAEAQQVLMNLSSLQGQYMLDNRTYAVGSTALTALTGSSTTTVDGTYTVTVTPNAPTTPPTYTITATPKSGTIQDGDGNLTVNYLGVQTGKWE